MYEKSLKRAKGWLASPYDKITQEKVKALIEKGGEELVESFYKDLDFGTDFELFDNNNLDAVLIASATSSHADYIEKALKNGKPVFCEKPIDLSLDRIRKCYERIKNINLPIQIGFNRRFDPSHAAIKKLLKENKIGKLNQVIITSRDPEMPSEDYYKSAGGLFKDMTIHDFDLARFYLDEDPCLLYTSDAADE